MWLSRHPGIRLTIGHEAPGGKTITSTDARNHVSMALAVGDDLVPQYRCEVFDPGRQGFATGEFQSRTRERQPPLRRPHGF